MDCPDCGETMIAFRVPTELREFGPGEGEGAAICPACLYVTRAEAADGSDFSRIIDAFPEGDTGAAMALAVGYLVESLALHREEVAALFEYVGDHGADPWLVLERLAVAPTVDPDADLGRLRRQLDQLLR